MGQRFPSSLSVRSAVIALGLCEASAHSFAQSAGPFDGNWLTVLTCPNFADARGYTWQFYSQVRNSQLQGQYGTQGRPASLALTGVIQPNGAATLEARGLSNDPAFTPGHAPQSTPIYYHVAAQFQGSQATGRRQETRPCDITFTRQ
jgi:hypothetical protein